MQRIDFSLFESEIETFTKEFYLGVKEPGIHIKSGRSAFLYKRKAAIGLESSPRRKKSGEPSH